MKGMKGIFSFEQLLEKEVRNIFRKLLWILEELDNVLEFLCWWFKKQDWQDTIYKR